MGGWDVSVNVSHKVGGSLSINLILLAIAAVGALFIVIYVIKRKRALGKED